MRVAGSSALALLRLQRTLVNNSAEETQKSSPDCPSVLCSAFLLTLSLVLIVTRCKCFGHSCRLLMDPRELRRWFINAVSWPFLQRRKSQWKRSRWQPSWVAEEPAKWLQRRRTCRACSAATRAQVMLAGDPQMSPTSPGVCQGSMSGWCNSSTEAVE